MLTGQVDEIQMKIKVRVTNFEPGLHLTFSTLFLEATHSFTPFSADLPFPSGSDIGRCSSSLTSLTVTWLIHCSFKVIYQSYAYMLKICPFVILRTNVYDK